ncbi:substrate-binding domain-containing protein [Paenibacillus xerothermodurans]|nr:substrate-binding domain-containing protein [Paenibacillus xerothermodurans]
MTTFALLAAISTSSCAQQAAAPHTTVARAVTLILKTGGSDYWQTVRMGAEAAAKEFNVALKVYEPGAEDDVSGQIGLVRQSLVEGTEAVVLAANDYEALADVIQEADSQQVPVITVDSEVSSPQVRSFIGIDNYKAGRQAGRKLIELIGEFGRIAVMSGGKESRNSQERERGLLDEIAKYHGVQVLKKEYCISDETRCGEHVRNIIAEHKQIDGIVALHAVSSIGVAAEIQALGLAGQVKVISFDSTPENIEFLQEGVIQAAIIQNPFSMGYLGVKHALGALNGSEVPGFVDTGTKVIDQENMFWSDNQKLLFPFVK